MVDHMEKSEAVIDIAKNGNQKILEDYKKFLELRVSAFTSAYKKCAKESPTLNKQTLQMEYPHYGDDAVQIHIQVQIFKVIQVSS